jgi:hypothetical protein
MHGFFSLPSFLPLFSSFFLFSFFQWFEFRASCLLGRYSTTWVMLSALFGLVIFQVWSHFCLGPASDHDLPTYNLHIAGTACPPHHSQLIDRDGVSLTFCPAWPHTVILPISAFSEVEITNESFLPSGKDSLSLKEFWVCKLGQVCELIKYLTLEKCGGGCILAFGRLRQLDCKFKDSLG